MRPDSIGVKPGVGSSDPARVDLELLTTLATLSIGAVAVAATYYVLAINAGNAIEMHNVIVEAHAIRAEYARRREALQQDADEEGPGPPAEDADAPGDDVPIAHAAPPLNAQELLAAGAPAS